MGLMVTIGIIRCAKPQSNCHHQQTNTRLLTGRMLFLLPNQQCRSIEEKFLSLKSVLIYVLVCCVILFASLLIMLQLCFFCGDWLSICKTDRKRIVFLQSTPSSCSISLHHYTVFDPFGIIFMFDLTILTRSSPSYSLISGFVLFLSVQNHTYI